MSSERERTRRADVLAILNEIVDPCSLASTVPIGLVDMGLIERLTLDGGTVEVSIITTAPHCMYVGHFITKIEDGLNEMPWVTDVAVTVSHQTAWDETRMHSEARRRLRERYPRQRRLPAVATAPRVPARGRAGCGPDLEIHQSEELAMSTSERPDLQPLDSLIVGRDSDVATFMRLPRTDDLDVVDIGVFGVALDMPTYRGGTRGGPGAVRDASRAIRRTNPRTGVSPFDLCNIADIGDVPVNQLDYAVSIAATEAFVRRLRENGVAPLAIGGDHSTTLPVLRGLFDGTPLGLLQFDAHADIQDTFFGLKDTHATVMRRAVEEGLVDPKRVVQLGLRGTRFAGAEDLQWGKDAGFTVLEYDDYEELGRPQAIEKILSVLGSGPVYVTYDIDGLDPTEAPGTPAREPGGLSMRDSQVILRALDGLDVVGGDVCEIAPSLDPSGLTALNGANLMFEIACLLAVAHRDRQS